MFRRKLKALGYHTIDKFNLESPVELKSLVVWLEDQKIRHYKIDEREDLRKRTGDGWTETYRNYLKALECPFNAQTDGLSCIEWLLEFAVRCEFEDKAEATPSLKGGLLGAGGSKLTRLPSSDEGPSALDIDITNQDFRGGLGALAKLLNISTHPEPVVVLEAARVLIEERLSNTAVAEAKAAKGKEMKSTASKDNLQITAKECGFDSGDPVLDEAAKVLRLLHLSDLRELQTRINELIVALQQVTADPKTDQRLGKVGR